MSEAWICDMAIMNYQCIAMGKISSSTPEIWFIHLTHSFASVSVSRGTRKAISPATKAGQKEYFSEQHVFAFMIRILMCRSKFMCWFSRNVLHVAGLSVKPLLTANYYFWHFEDFYFFSEEFRRGFLSLKCATLISWHINNFYVLVVVYLL